MSEHFSAADSECVVLTFKEGLFSAAAHDLKLKLDDFDLDIDGEASVRACFRARSLHVVCAMKSGLSQQGTLSSKDISEIERHIAQDVLNSDQFPEITFQSTQITKAPSGYKVTGELTLHGRKRTITLDVRPEPGRYVSEITLNQLDFGVKPFSAMMGAIKIKPEIQVQLSIPRK